MQVIFGIGRRGGGGVVSLLPENKTQGEIHFPEGFSWSLGGGKYLTLEKASHVHARGTVSVEDFSTKIHRFFFKLFYFQ